LWYKIKRLLNAGMDRIPLIHTTTAKQALNNKANCATSHTEQEQQGTEKKRTHFSFSKTLPQQAAKVGSNFTFLA